MISEGSPLADTIENEASDLRNSLQDNAGSLDAGSLKDDITNAVHHAGDEAHKFAHRAEEKIVDTGKAIRGRMSDYPLSAGVIAMGIGVLLGILYKRRS